MKWFKRLFCLHIWEKSHTDRIGDVYCCVKCGKKIRSDTLPISYKE